jgi:hypothetical protein
MDGRTVRIICFLTNSHVNFLQVFLNDRTWNCRLDEQLVKLFTRCSAHFHTCISLHVEAWVLLTILLAYQNKGAYANMASCAFSTHHHLPADVIYHLKNTRDNSVAYFLKDFAVFNWGWYGL